MFKLILFHPGIDLKQKLYLIHQYCICFYIDCFMYLVEKYFIELDKSVDEYLRIQKIYKILKRNYLFMNMIMKGVLMKKYKAGDVLPIPRKYLSAVILSDKKIDL